MSFSKLFSCSNLNTDFSNLNMVITRSSFFFFWPKWSVKLRITIWNVLISPYVSAQLIFNDVFSFFILQMILDAGGGKHSARKENGANFIADRGSMSSSFTVSQKTKNNAGPQVSK